jgi:hypothetical protein
MSDRTQYSMARLRKVYPIDEFWSHVDKTGGPDRLRWEPGEPCDGDGSPCWIWLGFTKRGYGHVWDGQSKRTLMAHRVARELENGPIPPGMCVLHWCDHRACVNPDHLYLGTMLDMVLKRDARGHHGYRTHPERWARGSRSGNAKLNEEQVREIRRLRQAGMGTKELAQKFNVHGSAIRGICDPNSMKWKHVNG